MEIFSCQTAALITLQGAVSDLKNSKSGFAGAGVGVVDCPTQLTLVTWICQLCSKTNTSEKYERTQTGNLLGWVGLVGVLWVL